MNTPTESAATESERNRIAGVLRSIAAWMIGEKKGDHCNLKRGDAANDLLSAAALLLAPQPPITKDAPAPAQDGVGVEEVFARLWHQETRNRVSGEVDEERFIARFFFMAAWKLYTAPPLQPTPPAQPVIGAYHDSYLHTKALDAGASFDGITYLFSKSQISVFIESCRPAQQDHSEDILDMVPAQPNGVPAGEADRRDALRYRWLRVQHWHDSNICVVRNPRETVRLGTQCPSNELLDEFIDAAIAQQKETEE